MPPALTAFEIRIPIAEQSNYHGDGQARVKEHRVNPERSLALTGWLQCPELIHAIVNEAIVAKRPIKVLTASVWAILGLCGAGFETAYAIETQTLPPNDPPTLLSASRGLAACVAVHRKHH